LGRDPEQGMNKYAKVLTIVLLAQAAAFYAIASRAEQIPVIPPLASFPFTIGNWQMQQDLPIEKEVQDVLKADDTLNRVYVDPARGEAAFLFIAFFKTQRYGQAPHSPKNCLPGAGWEPITTGILPITVAAWNGSIETNRYVVQHGDDKDVVVYWYQSHKRVIANEYAAKFWLVADSIRYHRSDTSLVKIVVPVRDNDVEGATRTAVNFVQALFPQILKQLPA
jgi:EpsI family protein